MAKKVIETDVEEKDEEEFAPRKQVSKGRKKSKTKLQKFADDWFVGEVSDFGRYLGKKVIAPAIKGAIIDLVETACEGFGDGLQMLFFNDEDRGRRGRHSREKRRYRSYSSYYDSDRKRKKKRRDYDDYFDDDDDDYDRKRIAFEYMEFETREDALDVLKELDDILEDHDYVTVADYYELSGDSSEFTDHDFGWESIRQARIVKNGGWYVLEMPRPRCIK